MITASKYIKNRINESGDLFCLKNVYQKLSSLEAYIRTI